MNGGFNAMGMMLIVSSTVALAAPKATVGNLCTSGEKVYLACETANKRSISLCGSEHAGIQYRFGRPGAIELRYPAQPMEGTGPLLFSHFGRFQRERTEIRFDNGGTTYTVFDDYEGSVHSAGVMVTDSRQIDHPLLCRGPIDSRLSELHFILRCDTESALNGGRCP